MKARIKKVASILTAVTTVVLLLLPLATTLLGPFNVQTTPVVHAQDSYQFLAPIGGLGEDIDVSSENSFPNYVQTIITLVIGFTILAAIVVIIAGGFQYMTTTSQGGTTEAKQNIQNAVFGLILALASVVILQTINPNLVELHSVETATTSGDSFIDSDLGTFGGTMYYADKSHHGDQHCFFVEGTASVADLFGGDPDDNRYICYGSDASCQEGRGEAMAEIDNSIGRCDFYYESIGEVIDNETGVLLETGIVGIDTQDKDAAQTACRGNAKRVAMRKYEQCTDGSNRHGSQSFDDGGEENKGGCSITCSIPNDES